MKEMNKKLKSKCDGLEIGVSVFVPDESTPIKGIFQISHGMAEHRKRYFPFMEFLTENGYIAVINDHRGHGESVKEKEDLGYFYDDTANFIVEDLHQVTQNIKKEYPNLPVYLFGHSMGSLAVRNYIKKYDNEIDKLIVCGSPSKNAGATFGILLCKMIRLFKGEKYRSKLIQKLTFSSYGRKFKKEQSKNSWVCSSNETISEYDKDKECGFIFTLNGFINLFKLVNRTYSEKGWEKKNLELPIFFIAGDEDPVIGNLNKWIEAYEFLQNEIGYKNMSHKLYKGRRHELLNEDIKEKVYRDIVDWVEE